jgi:transcriptional regulator with XRE-family HTH domain
LDKLWFERERKKLGLSLRGLARAMEMEPSALSRAFNSKRLFKANEVQRLAQVLEQPVHSVLQHLEAQEYDGEYFNYHVNEESSAYVMAPQAPVPTTRKHPLFGLMKGTTIVMSGVDLTRPADPNWGSVYDRNYDHGAVSPTKKRRSS